jgi:hypothetical protein
MCMTVVYQTLAAFQIDQHTTTLIFATLLSLALAMVFSFSLMNALLLLSDKPCWLSSITSSSSHPFPLA